MAKITEREITLKPESSDLMTKLLDNLQFRFSSPPKDRKIITKTMYPVESAEPIIQLEEVKEVMTLDFIRLNISNLEEIWDRNTWRDEPTIDISDTGQNDIPCLVFHDSKSTNLEKDRVLAIYTIKPGDVEESVCLDRVFLSTQRKYKDQIIVGPTWGFVKDTNMPQESLKSAIGIMKDLGYENIDIPETGKELKSRYAISEADLQQILHEDVSVPAVLPEDGEIAPIHTEEPPTIAQSSEQGDIAAEWRADIKRMDELKLQAQNQVYTMETILNQDLRKQSTPNRLSFIMRMAAELEKSNTLLDRVYSGHGIERLKATIEPIRKKLEKYVAKIGNSEKLASELPLLITKLEGVDLESGLSILLPLVLRKFMSLSPGEEDRIVYHRDSTANPYIESSLQMLSFLKTTLKKSYGVDQTPATTKIRQTILSGLQKEFSGHNTLAADIDKASLKDHELTTNEDKYLRWRQDLLLECLDQLSPQEALKLYKTTLKGQFGTNISKPLYGNSLTEAALNHILDEDRSDSPLEGVKKDIISQVLKGKFSSTIYQFIPGSLLLASNRPIIQKIAKLLEDGFSSNAGVDKFDAMPVLLENIINARDLVFYGGVLEAREDPVRDVLREFLITTDLSNFDLAKYDHEAFQALKKLKTDFMADILKIDKRFPITPSRNSKFGYSDYWYNLALESIRTYNTANSEIYQKVMA